MSDERNIPRSFTELFDWCRGEDTAVIEAAVERLKVAVTEALELGLDLPAADRLERFLLHPRMTGMISRDNVIERLRVIAPECREAGIYLQTMIDWLEAFPSPKILRIWACHMMTCALGELEAGAINELARNDDAMEALILELSKPVTT